MKNVKAVCFVTVVLFLGACPASGKIYFNDGLTHNIDYAINEYVHVDQHAPLMSTTVNLLAGGSINYPYSLHGYEHSRINICGGSIGDDLFIWDFSQVDISSGSIGSELYSFDFSQVDICGGSIGGLVSSNSSQVDISGGSIGILYSYDSSQIDISGGSIGGDLWPWDQSIMQIFGSDFAVDGQPFGYGELTSILGGWPQNEPLRHLTGTLLSGEIIDSDFRIGQNARIILIPEPATLALFSIGILYFRRRK